MNFALRVTLKVVSSLCLLAALGYAFLAVQCVLRASWVPHPAPTYGAQQASLTAWMTLGVVLSIAYWRLLWSLSEQ